MSITLSKNQLDKLDTASNYSNKEMRVDARSFLSKSYKKPPLLRQMTDDWKDKTNLRVLIASAKANRKRLAKILE